MKTKISSDLKQWLEKANIELPDIGEGFTNPWQNEEIQKILHERLHRYLDYLSYIEGTFLTVLWSAIGDNMKRAPALEARIRQVIIDLTYTLWDIKKAIYTGEAD